MTKEDKQIIDRAIKENWRISDRTRLKHLLEKNLELYRENAELQEQNSQMFNTIALQEQQIEKMKCCENCEQSDTECEGHIICSIGQFDDCLDNKMLYHTTNEKHYWELLKE